MPNLPVPSNGFSSTPVKCNYGSHSPTSDDMDHGVLSDDEDTFSLLSPVYHDSFDSDEEEPGETPRPSLPYSGLSISPIRCEPPKSPSEQRLDVSSGLSAWEVWLVNKAREDRLRMERRAEEENLLRDRQEQAEMEAKQKNIIVEEKIRKWLRMKREQEKQEQLMKLSKEEEEIYRQQTKQRETQRKAEQKYKDWLQKKNQEKIAKEKKEKEEASVKEEQERERRRRAEQTFKEWLARTNEKSQACPRSPRYLKSADNKSYPSPSFYNPIPWKPIHTPRPESPATTTSEKKAQKQRRGPQSPSAAFPFRNIASPEQLLHRSSQGRLAPSPLAQILKL